MHSHAPAIQIHNNFALSALPVRRPRKARDQRSFSTALMLLNVSAWAYALAASGAGLS